MSDDDADRSAALHASDRETLIWTRLAELAPLEFSVARWQLFRRTFGPVLEGAGVTVASTAVSAAITVAIDGGFRFYTITAFLLAAVYFKCRL